MVGTSLGLGFPLVWLWLRSLVGLSPLVVVGRKLRDNPDMFKL